MLGDRIAARLDAMLAAGWLDEVRRLAGTVPASAPAWNATGYGAVRDVVSGRTRLPEVRERILVETRQYAKRQRTWFRHQLDDESTTRVDPDDRSVEAIVNDWWEGRRRPNA